MGRALDLYDKEEFYRCLQCAVCTGSCPAAVVVPGFNPREIILRYMLYGEQEEVLQDEKLWACTTCHACQERCPHQITISGLLTHIMNLAARRGNLPRALKENVQLMARTGWSVRATAHSDRVRRELGLRPLQRPNDEEIRGILRAAGLDQILELS
jgi:heterodisulfide reductase subunit C